MAQVTKPNAAGDEAPWSIPNRLDDQLLKVDGVGACRALRASTGCAACVLGIPTRRPTMVSVGFFCSTPSPAARPAVVRSRPLVLTCSRATGTRTSSVTDMSSTQTRRPASTSSSALEITAHLGDPANIWGGDSPIAGIVAAARCVPSRRRQVAGSMGAREVADLVLDVGPAAALQRARSAVQH